MTDASASVPRAVLTKETCVFAVRDQVSAVLEGETVILSMHDGVYHSVDRVGSRIWSLAASPTTLGAIHQTLVDEYDVGSEDAWRDLVTLVEDLRRVGLMECAPCIP